MSNEIRYGMFASRAKPVDIDYLTTNCVGEGWRGILTRLIDDIFAMGWDGQLLQCKEKFGGLRFYINGGSTEIYNRIGDAEIESTHTCEVCGERGEIRYDLGWARCLCDAEYQKALKQQRRVVND